MNFETLFGLYYTKIRGEESPPAITDPEWKIAIRNYNSALDRLENFDGTKWNFMKAYLSASTQVSPALDRTLTTGDTVFTAPTDMFYPGGLYWKIDGNNYRTAPMKIYKPEDLGTLSQNSQYGYFLGDQHNGFVFYLNPAVPSNENAWTLDYMYYKKLTRLDPDTEDGTSIIAGAPSEYLANFMAAQKFLDSRNFPAYQIMKRDSEESLKMMKLQNNSGDSFNVPQVQDSGPGFGY